MGQTVRPRPKKDEVVEAKNGEAEAKNGEAKAKNGEAKNGHANGVANGKHTNGDAKNGDSAENGTEHKNGDSANGHSKTEATTTEEAMETSEEKTELATKRKADEVEPIPVSAEKIAKLKENETEEKTETEATPAAAE